MDVWQGITVVRRCHIELAVVAARAPSTICFWDHVQRRGPRRVGGANDAHFGHLAELVAGNGEFIPEETASTRKDGRTRRWDGVVDAVLGCRGVVDGGRDHRWESIKDCRHRVTCLRAMQAAEVEREGGRFGADFDVDRGFMNARCPKEAAAGDVDDKAVLTEEV